MLGFGPYSNTAISSVPDNLTIVNTIGQSLGLNQVLDGGVQHITGAMQTLTLTQTNVFNDMVQLLQTLTFVQTNICNLTIFQNIINNLIIGQTNVFNYVNNIESIQTLSFKHIAQINSNIYYLMCQCLQLKQSFGNGLDISVAQTLNLQWLEREVYEQVLAINQMILTNFDDVHCCEPVGYNDSRDIVSTMNMNQTVGCGMVYNVHISHNMGLLQSAAWT